MLLSSSTLAQFFSWSSAPCFISFLWQWQNKAPETDILQFFRIGFRIVDLVSELVLGVGVVSPGGHLPTLVAQPLGHIGTRTPWWAHLRLLHLLFGDDNILRDEKAKVILN